MTNAWVVRPNPGTNRLHEFRTENIVAIGWPRLGDLSECDEADIRERIKETYDWNKYTIGQNVGQINRFVNEMKTGDFVVVPSGGNIYLGEIISSYHFNDEVKEKGYPHQRDIDWYFEGNAVNRSTLPGQLHDSLKGRLTVFSTHTDLVEQLAEQKPIEHGRDDYAELQSRYFEKLQAGELRGVHSASFEDVVEVVFDNYFPNITRQATTSDDQGDTDLKADLPGGVTVRVQVKYFYPEQGELPAKAVHQLTDSMESGDNGIVVTSTEVSEEAEKAANQSEMKVEIIDGAEFTDLLFDNIEEFDSEELEELGLRDQPPELLGENI